MIRLDPIAHTVAGPRKELLLPGTQFRLLHALLNAGYGIYVPREELYRQTWLQWQPPKPDGALRATACRLREALELTGGARITTRYRGGHALIDVF